MRSTAIHEAGHAVIGRVLDMCGGGASIVDDDNFAGRVDIRLPSAIQDHWEKQLQKYRYFESVFIGRILTCMAGAEAEIMLAGSHAEESGDVGDRDQITLMFDGASEAPGLRELREETHEARLRRFTRVLVRRHSDKIERVAEALLMRQHLSGEEIDELVFGPKEKEKARKLLNVRLENYESMKLALRRDSQQEPR